MTGKADIHRISPKNALCQINHKSPHSMDIHTFFKARTVIRTLLISHLLRLMF